MAAVARTRWKKIRGGPVPASLLPMGRSRDSASRDKLAGSRTGRATGELRTEDDGVLILSDEKSGVGINMQKKVVFAEPHRANLCRETACDDGAGSIKVRESNMLVRPPAFAPQPGGRTSRACLARRAGWKGEKGTETAKSAGGKQCQGSGRSDA